MTEKQRMLAVLSGEPPDGLPWAPRMDLWLIARRARGDLPGDFGGRNTADVADWLGVGCHAVRCDRSIPREPGDLVLRGLGLDNHPDYPFRCETRGVEVSFRGDGENLESEFSTPHGTVRTHLHTSPDMLKNGISLPFFKRYAVSSREDLRAVSWLFERIEVVPTPDAYRSFHERLGERGLAVAAGPVAASPMHLILHELMPMDEFFYAYAEDREGLRGLTRSMEPLFESMLDALAQSEAELVHWGGNYDRDLTWPPFFREEIVPWLSKASARLRESGKYLATHTDGENRDLLGLYRESGFDVAESVCPSPMSDLTLREIREGMGNAVTVWGGVPSIVLLPESIGETEFESWLQGFRQELERDPRRFIGGVSDNVPPDADPRRLARVGQTIRGVPLRG